jgi:hypothetical protein
LHDHFFYRFRLAMASSANQVVACVRKDSAGVFSRQTTIGCAYWGVTMRMGWPASICDQVGCLGVDWNECPWRDASRELLQIITAGVARGVVAGLNVHRHDLPIRIMPWLEANECQSQVLQPIPQSNQVNRLLVVISGAIAENISPAELAPDEVFQIEEVSHIRQAERQDEIPQATGAFFLEKRMSS